MLGYSLAPWKHCACRGQPACRLPGQGGRAGVAVSERLVCLGVLMQRSLQRIWPASTAVLQLAASAVCTTAQRFSCRHEQG